MAEIVISIFGTGRAQPGEPAFVLAEQVGHALAQAGYIIANGGYGGTMLAAARGAAAAGGKVIGVTCRAFERSAANEFVTREVVTDSLQERLHNLIKAGRAYVVLPGGTGTLLELAAVWELKNKGILEAARPIVLLGDSWRPLVELVAADDPRCLQHVAFAAGPDEAVETIRKALEI